MKRARSVKDTFRNTREGDSDAVMEAAEAGIEVGDVLAIEDAER